MEETDDRSSGHRCMTSAQIIKAIYCRTPILRPIDHDRDEPIWVICRRVCLWSSAMYRQGLHGKPANLQFHVQEVTRTMELRCVRAGNARDTRSPPEMGGQTDRVSSSHI